MIVTTNINYQKVKSIDFQGNYVLDEIEDLSRRLLDEGLLRYSVVTFVGDLGSGKTTLIQSICRLLGVEDNIASPTFSIVNEYSSTGGPIYHIDLYRLKDIQEAMDIGIEEYLYGNGICFIEWPQIILDICPYPHIRIEIENLGKFTRTIHMYETTET